MINNKTNQKVITLDAREEFRSGRHPCDSIHNALDRVAADEVLRLLVPFEPVPLFELARSKGLAHDAKPISGGDWEILFSHDEEGNMRNPEPVKRGEFACGCGCHETTPTEVVQVDARHLEPPQPMVKILESLQALPKDAALRARTDRRPIHLYPVLETRGFTGESEEQSDGSFITHIRRR